MNPYASNLRAFLDLIDSSTPDELDTYRRVLEHATSAPGRTSRAQESISAPARVSRYQSPPIRPTRPRIKATKVEGGPRPLEAVPLGWLPVADISKKHKLPETTIVAGLKNARFEWGLFEGKRYISEASFENWRQEVAKRGKG